MKLKTFFSHPVLKIFTNAYVIIFSVFLIWMLFFDGNSYLYHRKLNQEIKDLENWNAYHKKKISEDKQTIQKLQNPIELERYAREKYLMRKENEEIFLIEFDTVKQ